jgi:hypothetical protein
VPGKGSCVKGTGDDGTASTAQLRFRKNGTLRHAEAAFTRRATRTGGKPCGNWLPLAATPLNLDAEENDEATAPARDDITQKLRCLAAFIPADPSVQQ